MRLLILTPRELTQDVRARRQAIAARAHGYEVFGLSGTFAGDEPAPLEGVRIIRVGGDTIGGKLRRAGLGGVARTGPIVRELRGLFRLARLTRTTVSLAWASRGLPGVQIVHANDFDALPAAMLVARRNHARLVYDAHELYALMEDDPPRLYGRIALSLERLLARRADAVVTNCDPYAETLRMHLRLARKPIVHLNAPALVDVALPDRKTGPLRAIYQAAADAPGRPLADLLTAATNADNVELTIRVVHLDEKRLLEEIGNRRLGGQVQLAPPVPVTRLVEALEGFDVGVIVRRPLTPNDELPVPGKLYEYMMAGLAVAVPRLVGLAPFVEHEKIGIVYEPGRPESLGQALTELARQPKLLEAMQRRARRLAVERFNAEAEVEALLRAWDAEPTPA